MNAQPSQYVVVIGIAGASGSGKTYLAQHLMREIAQIYYRGDVSEVALICEDFYYKDQSSKTMSERVGVNYDHPGAFDHDLLVRHLRQLKAGEAVDIPQYDYRVHTRSTEVKHQPARDIVVVEGILLFTDAAVRAELSMCVYVQTPLDLCFIRRVTRDMATRGRSFESVKTQYLTVVRPMYFQFVQPSRQWASVVVCGSTDIAAEIAPILATLRAWRAHAKIEQTLSPQSVYHDMQTHM